ncbi:MAG: TIGR02206 family membrane protein [Planctomycetota bacterium]
MDWWPAEFEPYGLTHLAVFVGWTLTIAAIVTLGRRWRGTPREAALRRACGVVLLASQTWYVVHGALEPNGFEPAMDIPLHVCDIGAWIAGIAMLMPSLRWAQTVTFFWGYALTTQAFVTPTVKVGPADAVYWLYWLQHGGLVGTAVYIGAVGRYRPRPRDAAALLLATAALLIAAVPINATLGSNYVWIGDTDPDSRTVFDVLGPWPRRAFLIVLIAHAVMALVWAVTLLVTSRRPDPAIRAVPSQENAEAAA